MKCVHCGAKLTKNEAQCPSCGQPQLRKTRSQFPLGLLCGVAVGLLVFSVLLLTGVASFSDREPASNTLPDECISSLNLQGRGSASFDELLNEYIDAMRQFDLNRVTALYACEFFADENLAMKQAPQILLDSNPCVGDSFAQPIGRYIEAWNMTGRSLIRNYMTVAACRSGQKDWYYLPGYDMMSARVETHIPDGTLYELIEYLDDSKLQEAFTSMELERIVEKLTDRDNDKVKRALEYYAADQYISCLATVKIDGESYPLYVEAFSRSGRWYLARSIYYNLFQQSSSDYYLIS